MSLLRTPRFVCRATGASPAPPLAFFVGAGPGSADLLTLRAVARLQAADVVVYDDLVDAAALRHAPPDAQRLHVGKRGGRPSMKQADIDQLLVHHCRQGSRVVRLKGGCPSVFSRVASEAAALSAHAIPFEFVPGVSSALAAPLAAGFPLTEANAGRGFAVVSGHQPEQVDWGAYAGAPTLVVLMGGRELGGIAGRLLALGRAPTTPVAVVHAAFSERQRVWHATLHTVADATAGVPLSPCVVVVGEVTGLPQTWSSVAAAAEDARML